MISIAFCSYRCRDCSLQSCVILMLILCSFHGYAASIFETRLFGFSKKLRQKDSFNPGKHETETSSRFPRYKSYRLSKRKRSDWDFRSSKVRDKATYRTFEKTRVNFFKTRVKCLIRFVARTKNRHNEKNHLNTILTLERIFSARLRRLKKKIAK